MKHLIEHVIHANSAISFMSLVYQMMDSGVMERGFQVSMGLAMLISILFNNMPETDHRAQ
jgi:hypothetical protein